MYHRKNLVQLYKLSNYMNQLTVGICDKGSTVTLQEEKTVLASAVTFLKLTKWKDWSQEAAAAAAWGTTSSHNYIYMYIYIWPSDRSQILERVGGEGSSLRRAKMSHQLLHSTPYPIKRGRSCYGVSGAEEDWERAASEIVRGEQLR